MRAPPSQSSARHAARNPIGGAAAAPDPLLQSSGLFIVVLDDDARIVSFNSDFSKFLGMRPEELRHAMFTSLVAPDEAQASFEEGLQQTRDGFDGGGGIDAWIAAAGERRPVQWWLSRQEAEPGSPQGFIITGIDLSSNRQAWDRFAEQEARLRSILDTAVDGIVTIDERGIIETSNPATEEIFGYSSEELIGQNVTIFMPQPYRQEHDTYLSNYLSTGEKKIIGTGREVEGRRKDGSTFPLDLAVSEFHVSGQRRFMGLMRDLSGRKRSEQEARRHLDELAHASRLSILGEMATGIAHEVNQPLAAIVSYAQACLNMLSSDNADVAVIKDALSKITAQGRRAGDIIHHLRQLVRKDQTARTELDLNGSVRAVLNLFKNEVRLTGVTLSLDLAEMLHDVEADRVQIEQVLLNLVRNALDVLSMQRPGSRHLSISTRPGSNTGAEVCVTDTGPGLEGNDPERLFETFYTTKPDGLGVGLSISRSIIESHGGRLWARENRSGGLSFYFTLPGPRADER
ncbi:MAG: PAS domain S-box protein [Gammaproteobacteria bacterium]|nr:PAS domain S-box protein [Gammaproteobacteria bacterium]